jgi:hypothetical protein
LTRAAEVTPGEAVIDLLMEDPSRISSVEGELPITALKERMSVVILGSKDARIDKSAAPPSRRTPFIWLEQEAKSAMLTKSAAFCFILIM